jgi:hypothetical protein
VPVLLFKLTGAPEDEAEEVRELLYAHNIEFYETQAGRWAIGTAAIWLRDDSRLMEARALLDEYQVQRVLRVREEYKASQKTGRLRSLLGRLLANPLAALLSLMFILLILYLSLAPFLNMRGWLK